MKRWLLIGLAATTILNVWCKSIFFPGDNQGITNNVRSLSMLILPEEFDRSSQYGRVARSLGSPEQYQQDIGSHVQYRIIADTGGTVQKNAHEINQYPGDAERQAFIDWYDKEPTTLQGLGKDTTTLELAKKDQVVAMALGITMGFVGVVLIIVGTVYSYKKALPIAKGKCSSA